MEYENQIDVENLDLINDGCYTNEETDGFNDDNLATQNREELSRVLTSVRIKPLFEGSRSSKQQLISCLSCAPGGQRVQVHRDLYDKRWFSYDHVFDSNTSNSQLYSHSRLRSIIRDVTHSGYNGSAIAYGQTGSGKTYTMFGSDRSPGLALLCLQDIFAAVEEHRSRFRAANVIVTLFQIYVEQVYDLLSERVEDLQRPLQIREDKELGPFIENITYVPVCTYSEAVNVIKCGLSNRVSKWTSLNAQSSRSHAIVKLFLDFEDDDLDNDNDNDCDNDYDNDNDLMGGYHDVGTENYPIDDAALGRLEGGLGNQQLLEHFPVNSSPQSIAPSQSTFYSSSSSSNLRNGRPTTATTIATLTSDDNNSYTNSRRSTQQQQQRSNASVSSNPQTNLSINSISSNYSSLRRNALNRQRRLSGASSVSVSTSVSVSGTTTASAGTATAYQYQQQQFLQHQMRQQQQQQQQQLSYELDEHLPVSRAGEKTYSYNEIDSEAERVVANLSTTAPRMKFRRRIVTLVDLAGSERIHKSIGMSQLRLKESAAINKSISALGNCIEALSRGKRVPYRDSKLTRLLQECIGGNAKSVLIACVSQNSGNVEETISTLQFAARALRIQKTVSRSKMSLVASAPRDFPLPVPIPSTAPTAAMFSQQSATNGFSNNELNFEAVQQIGQNNALSNRQSHQQQQLKREDEEELLAINYNNSGYNSHLQLVVDVPVLAEVEREESSPEPHAMPSTLSTISTQLSMMAMLSPNGTNSKDKRQVGVELVSPCPSPDEFVPQPAPKSSSSGRIATTSSLLDQYCPQFLPNADVETDAEAEEEEVVAGAVGPSKVFTFAQFLQLHLLQQSISQTTNENFNINRSSSATAGGAVDPVAVGDRNPPPCLPSLPSEYATYTADELSSKPKPTSMPVLDSNSSNLLAGEQSCEAMELAATGAAGISSDAKLRFDSDSDSDSEPLSFDEGDSCRPKQQSKTKTKSARSFEDEAEVGQLTEDDEYLTKYIIGRDDSADGDIYNREEAEKGVQSPAEKVIEREADKEGQRGEVIEIVPSIRDEGLVVQSEQSVASDSADPFNDRLTALSTSEAEESVERLANNKITDKKLKSHKEKEMLKGKQPTRRSSVGPTITISSSGSSSRNSNHNNIAPPTAATLLPSSEIHTPTRRRYSMPTASSLAATRSPVSVPHSASSAAANSPNSSRSSWLPSASSPTREIKNNSSNISEHNTRSNGRKSVHAMLFNSLSTATDTMIDPEIETETELEADAEMETETETEAELDIEAEAGSGAIVGDVTVIGKESEMLLYPFVDSEDKLVMQNAVTEAAGVADVPRATAFKTIDDGRTAACTPTLFREDNDEQLISRALECMTHPIDIDLTIDIGKDEDKDINFRKEEAVEECVSIAGDVEGTIMDSLDVVNEIVDIPLINANAAKISSADSREGDATDVEDLKQMLRAKDEEIARLMSLLQMDSQQQNGSVRPFSGKSESSSLALAAALATEAVGSQSNPAHSELLQQQQQQRQKIHSSFREAATNNSSSNSNKQSRRRSVS